MSTRDKESNALVNSPSDNRKFLMPPPPWKPPKLSSEPAPYNKERPKLPLPELRTVSSRTDNTWTSSTKSEDWKPSNSTRPPWPSTTPSTPLMMQLTSPQPSSPATPSSRSPRSPADWLNTPSSSTKSPNTRELWEPSLNSPRTPLTKLMSKDSSNCWEPSEPTSRTPGTISPPKTAPESKPSTTRRKDTTVTSAD